MLIVQDVNISSTVNRQLQMIGNQRQLAVAALKRLGRTGGKAGKPVGTTEAGQVRKAARVHGSAGKIFSVPYGDDNFCIFYYRTGGDIKAEDKLSHEAAFKKQEASGGGIWTLLLGRFEGMSLILPTHDNTPFGEVPDTAAA
ncbi:hypothetical protein [Sphingomonas radiodurans]|uniref:hypothetical protein n=1 Tax=Sphingomonas radiodurans TaxID=2890321 RepID=UPI001E325634|nr:hypothetical protein [Sphingomonas radiodurans]WBH17110.1 hypothetical protein LLW23_03040 [Sphingomonas radiodurans]